MTAEIAILNRSAVALAADSTVTVGDRKTYSSVNKVFTLSKLRPVGAMIFGAASLMGAPWESLLKQYRKELGDKSFETLREYADDLISFLARMPSVFPAERQGLWIGRSAFFITDMIRGQIDEAIEKAADSIGSVTLVQIQEKASEVIRQWNDIADKEKLVYGAADTLPQEISKTYATPIADGSKEALGDLEIPSDSGDVLRGLIARLIACGWSENTTGLVVAGFGESELFPSVWTVQVARIALDTVFFWEDEADCHTIGLDKSEGALLPFAQRDVVTAFLTGCEPTYVDMMAGTFSEVFENYPEVIVRHVTDTLSTLTEQQRDEIVRKIGEDMLSVQQSFFEKFEKHRNDQHIQPLLEVVAALPKDELASMAEALVNLTAVKRKMSMEVETVGGPVDVAVISKGDGFVWIKRKHYFSAEFNPHFMTTYFQR